MLRLVFALVGASLSIAAHGAEPARVVNIAEHFAAFWDANEKLPRAVQVENFKQQFASRFPAFYAIERFDGERTQAEQDQRIADAIESFPVIREQYLRKARQFDAELPQYQATFKRWFPDYRQTEDVYVTHSLGEMDAGPRVVDGRLVLVFGIDAMVKYHGTNNETAFFMHELFHMHHAKAMKGCDSNQVWASLWAEGLATYVSKQMHPAATVQEMLLDVPTGMAANTEAVLPAALAQLEPVLDSEDLSVKRDLFQTRGGLNSGLPGRRGYYLGYLVAQEAAKASTVSELAALGCSDARQLVKSTVRKLRSQHPM